MTRMVQIFPTFPVDDLTACRNYYVETLGFTVNYEDGVDYAQVHRDGAAKIALYARWGLKERKGCAAFEQPFPSRATIVVEGIDGLFAELSAKGVFLDEPNPVDYGKEMTVVDCEGNVLDFVEFKRA